MFLNFYPHTIGYIHEYLRTLRFTRKTILRDVHFAARRRRFTDTYLYI